MSSFTPLTGAALLCVLTAVLVIPASRHMVRTSRPTAPSATTMVLGLLFFLGITLTVALRLKDAFESGTICLSRRCGAGYTLAHEPLFFWATALIWYLVGLVGLSFCLFIWLKFRKGSRP